METETTTETLTTVENAERTIEIPSENRESLEKRLVKLAKRAEKLGCPIAWTWGAQKLVPSMVQCEAHTGRTCLDCDGSGTQKVLCSYDVITVSTARPSFAGWQFLGTLNHTEIVGSVLRRMVPGIECPAEAIAAAPGQCDHCKKVRNRTETFVVRHEDGTVRVIGRNCIRDFLGHKSPDAIADGLSFVWAVEGALDEESQFGGGGGGGAHMLGEYVLQALAVAFAVVRIEGSYKPASFDRSTRSIMTTVLFGWGRAGKDARDTYVVTLADCERAWAALEWLSEQAPTNDFMHNLLAVAGAEFVRGKQLGFLAAIIPAYDREAIKRSAPKAPSTHVGEVGKRGTLGVGTVERIFTFDGQWGTSFVFLIRLESGAIVKWKASRGGEDWLVPGARVAVLGTVKAHVDYKGTPQTEITRAVLTQVDG